MTAKMTAAGRACESERPDRLFNDPLARALAGEEAFSGRRRCGFCARRRTTLRTQRHPVRHGLSSATHSATRRRAGTRPRKAGLQRDCPESVVANRSQACRRTRWHGVRLLYRRRLLQDDHRLAHRRPSGHRHGPRRIGDREVPKTCRSSARPHHPLRHRIAASSPRCASASAWTRSGHTMASPTSTVRIAAPGTKFKEVVIRFC